ncbi:hypothetical protein HY933_04045 [Candidatus Falkowbacteria bacterium]|nr:hypothetical protein [Candidatus Falkowbacteria bacterium]
MLKLILGLLAFILVLSPVVALADSGEDFASAKALVDAKTPCSQLSNEQLETIGDYYMEQIHPGSQHQWMEQMMGGDDSDNVALTHLVMAKQLYCGQNTGWGMMGGGMMNWGGGSGLSRLGYAMHGGWGGTMMVWGWLVSLLVVVFLGLGIAAFIKYLFNHKR